MRSFTKLCSCVFLKIALLTGLVNSCSNQTVVSKVSSKKVSDGREIASIDFKYILEKSQGKYYATYGYFFNKQTVDLELKLDSDDTTKGKVIVKFSEYPDYGECRGLVSLGVSPQFDDQYEINDYNGLYCSGLKGQKFEWVNFQFSLIPDLKKGDNFTGIVFLQHPGIKKTRINEESSITKQD